MSTGLTGDFKTKRPYRIALGSWNTRNGDMNRANLNSMLWNILQYIEFLRHDILTLLCSSNNFLKKIIVRNE